MKKFGEIGKVKDLVLDGFRAGLQFKGTKPAQGINQGTQFTLEMIENHAIIDKFIDALQDDESKHVICWLIRFRAALSIIGDKQTVLQHFFPSAISHEEHEVLLQKARNLPEAKLEQSIPVDLIENFLLGGYALSGICETLKGDTVLDLGVFNGNSTIDLARRAGPSGRVIGFEPNPTLAKIAQKNIERMKVKAEIETAAAGQELGEIRFRQAGAASRVDPQGNISVPCITVDRFVNERALGNINFLKLDIEGHEVQALKGAQKTIEHSKPKIAVCVYHLATDLTLIPTLISSFHAGYRFYVRHRARHDGEIVMFCVP